MRAPAYDHLLMASDPRSQLPTLAAGSLRSVTPCRRRLARHLDPDDRPYSPTNDGRFRLGKAIDEAIRAAHDSLDIAAPEAEFDDILVRSIPPELGMEEARRFSAALDHYSELAESRPMKLHPNAGETLERPSRDSTWALRASMGLLLHNDIGDIELRHVNTSPAPSPLPLQCSDSDLGRVALLGPATLGRTVRVVELWTEGTATVVVHEVTPEAVTALRQRLVDTVDQAREHPNDVTAGWWCTTCPAIAGCPAIPATRFETVLGSFG